MTTDRTFIRAGVCYVRRNLTASTATELFIGDGHPSRCIGTIIFNLHHPPFRRRTTDKKDRLLVREHALLRLRYLMPSPATLCYVVRPNRDAIRGAQEEHDEEQRLDSPAWNRIIQNIRGAD